MAKKPKSVKAWAAANRLGIFSVRMTRGYFRRFDGRKGLEAIEVFPVLVTPIVTKRKG